MELKIFYQHVRLVDIDYRAYGLVSGNDLSFWVLSIALDILYTIPKIPIKSITGPRKKKFLIVDSLTGIEPVSIV